MEIDISQERFVAHGLVILARNYLDVYPYDRWSDKVINHRCSQRSESMSQPGLQGEGDDSVPNPGATAWTGACSWDWKLSFA